MTASKNTEVAKPGDVIRITNPRGFSYNVDCVVIDEPDRYKDRDGVSKPSWQPDDQIWFIGKDGHSWWTISANYIIIKRASSLVVECEEHQQPEHDQDIDKRLSKARDDLLGGIFGG